MRQPMMIANWKMNKSLLEAKKFVEQLSAMLEEKLPGRIDSDLVICAPFTALSALSKMMAGTPLSLGAQNMHWEKEGAFTGEISPLMLKELGVRYVIIGHSERRTLFNENNQVVCKKIASAFAHGLLPILCIGENLEQRRAEKTEALLKEQLYGALEGLKLEGNIMQKLVIAYEPVWAIGTGTPAEAEDARSAATYIRAVLNALWGEPSQKIRILYGGSVNPENITSFIKLQEIDGALVGGSSLKVTDFFALVNAVIFERGSEGVL
ncbi:MAG: triose-phosphate isomerase [Dethiobacteria bacterium]|jgi:triosephosphate isomerase